MLDTNACLPVYLTTGTIRCRPDALLRRSLRRGIARKIFLTTALVGGSRIPLNFSMLEIPSTVATFI